jgi:predicted glycosyltransferase
MTGLLSNSKTSSPEKFMALWNVGGGVVGATLKIVIALYLLLQ